MTITSVYPVLMSADVAAAAEFYRTNLGFEVTFETDWYVSMVLNGFELAILAHEHATIPAGYRALPQGVIVNIELDDVDAVYQRMVVDGGTQPLLALRDEDFGQRHFIVEAPDGVLLDVIMPIEPSASFSQAYASDASTSASGASTS